MNGLASLVAVRSEGRRTESYPALDGAALGDELLVDGSAYGVGEEWAELVAVAPGSASVYPYKVQLSNGVRGQYRADEALGWRRPLEVHLGALGRPPEEVAVGGARWPR